jgi:hypothetical protein
MAAEDALAPLRRGPAHRPVERGTPDGKTTISCAGPRCTSWDPRPFPSRREAEFWYDRHIRQPLTHQLW